MNEMCSYSEPEWAETLRLRGQLVLTSGVAPADGAAVHVGNIQGSKKQHRPISDYPVEKKY